MGERMLVAGVGNIFRSDDGFGCAVAAELLRRDLPPGVDVVDYGIRGLHLAFDVDDGVGALVVVDTVPDTGGPVGSLVVLEVEADQALGGGPASIDAHAMDPGSVFAALRSTVGSLPPTYVVGCRPADLGDGIGLSEPVAAAVGPAADRVVDLVARLDPRAAISSRRTHVANQSEGHP